MSECVSNGNAEPSRSVRICGIIACLLASFIVTYALYSIGGAIKSMKTDLGITNSEALWATYVPIVTTISFNLIAAALANRYGKKKMLVWGLAIILIVNFVPLLTRDYSMIVVSRAVMGIGMAFVYVSSVSILTDLSGSRIHTNSGLFSSLSFVGEISVVCFGFLFAQGHGWNLMVLITIPVTALALILLKNVPDVKETRHKEINILDHVLFNISTTFTIVGIATTPDTEWGEYVLIIGLVLLVIFIIRQMDERNRIIESHLFKQKAFAIASITAIVFYTMSYTVQQLMNNYIQISQIEGMLTIATVLINVRIIIIIVMSPIFSSLSKKFRDTTFPMIGIIFAFISISSLCLLRLGGTIAIVGVGISCVATGIATAMFTGPNMTVMMTNVSKEERNAASSVNNLIRQICKIDGTLFIILFLSIFAESEQAAAFELGFIVLAMVCSVLTVLGLYAVIKYRKNEIPDTNASL